MASLVTSSLLFAGVNTPGAAGTQSFQSMVSVLTDSFQLCGWVNTNAVGSINTASVSPPPTFGGSGSFVGYQVWRFDDWWHNSGSAPVFIRVEYGSAGIDGFGRNPGIGVSVGFTHDGSGTVGGPILGVNNTGRAPHVAVGTPTSGVLYTHRICIVSGGDFGMILADNLGTAAMMYIERTKDAFGNSTNEGIVVGQFNGITRGYRQNSLIYSASAAQTPISEVNPIWIGSARASSNYNGDVNLSMFIPMLPYGTGYPSRMAGVVRSGDFASGVTHKIPMFGTSSTYFVSANTSFSTMIQLNRVAEAGPGYLIIRQD